LQKDGEGKQTHSFHFLTGEMTITLEDVLMLWGLPLDGLPIIGDVDQDWEVDVLEMFGQVE
jgi:Plant mobile domain